MKSDKLVRETTPCNCICHSTSLLLKFKDQIKVKVTHASETGKSERQQATS